jgi:hypothetical protein
VITADSFEYQLDSKDLKRHPLLEILLKTPKKKPDFEAISFDKSLCFGSGSTANRNKMIN